MRVLLIGGTGFIGRHLAARLVADSHQVLVPTRRYGKGRDLLLLPTVTLLDVDVHDDAALDGAVAGCDAVVNLVGLLHGRRGRPYGKDFRQVHVELPRRIAQACRRHGVARLLHVSALGASAQGPSAYHRSKADGEQAVIEAFAGYEQGACTIFRPSVVFGPDDNFMNLFARLARWLPVIFLAGARARLQPVYVGDVVKAMVNSLRDSHTYGKTYALAGYQAYTLAELVSLAARWSGRPRPVIPVPMAVGRLQACMLGLLPGPPVLSQDNLDALRADSVCQAPMAPELGVFPTPLESIAPRYLKAPQ